MSKFSRLMILTLLVTLTACNRPQGQPKNVPPDTAAATITTEITTDPETQTPDPTAVLPTDEPPLAPTADLDQIITGDPIPLLGAGTEITLLEVEMVTNNFGWGIGVADSRDHHLFKTEDGGSSWKDVTPPQPIVMNNGGLLNANFGIWDQNTAWVAYGGAEYIWSTDDGGRSWQPALVEFLTTYDGMFSVLDKNHIWFFQFLEGGMQKVFTAVNRSADGGDSWELLLDPYNDATIQAFDKTGSAFITPDYGWLTRDFRAVDPNVRINTTIDGGITWDSLVIPPPPPLPDLFQQDLAALYDPYLIAQGQGYFRLFCRYFENEVMKDRDFLYKTTDNGANWEILEAPRGDFYYISDLNIFSIGRDIFKSGDGGNSWQFVKSVNWDGKFSFVDEKNALGIAYDPDDDEYALVKTSDGCQTFQIIEPQVIAPFTSR